MTPEETTYSLTGGRAFALRHFDEVVPVEPGGTATLPTPPAADPGPAPTQPRGRSPREVAARLDARPE